MSSSVIKNQLNSKISEIYGDEKTLIVLKGIPVSYVDSEIEKIDLSSILISKYIAKLIIYSNGGIVSPLSYRSSVLTDVSRI